MNVTVELDEEIIELDGKIEFDKSSGGTRSDIYQTIYHTYAQLKESRGEGVYWYKRPLKLLHAFRPSPPCKVSICTVVQVLVLGR